MNTINNTPPTPMLLEDTTFHILDKLEIENLKIMRILNHWWNERVDRYAMNCGIKEIMSCVEISNFLLLNRHVEALSRVLKNSFMPSSSQAELLDNLTPANIKIASQMIVDQDRDKIQDVLKKLISSKDANSPNCTEVTQFNPSLFSPWFDENISIFLQQENIQFRDNFSIYTLPTEILMLENLQTISFFGTFFSTFPVEICSLTNLRKLRFLSGNITELPAALGDLKQLTRLQINSCKLRHLPKEICLLKQLVYLQLDKNQITCLPANFCSLTNLKYLDFNFNNIAYLPSDIGSLTSLQDLLLQSNRLESIPSTIGNLTELGNLNLTNNKLVTLPTEIRHLKKLQRLHIEGNSIFVKMAAGLFCPWAR
jgi:Leucine-rich repeat (LRR) protein